MDYGKVENFVENVFYIVFNAFSILIVENNMLYLSLLRVYPHFSNLVENDVCISFHHHLIWKIFGKRVGKYRLFPLFILLGSKLWKNKWFSTEL